jgi:hypothetical protein
MLVRIKIRIYNPYDLDIIALAEAPGFSVSNAMKQTLIYYAQGMRYLIEVPNLTEHLVNEKYVKGFYVELNEDIPREAKAIELIRSVPEGLRNSFMKSILRASLEVAPVSLHLGDGGAEFVANLIANKRYGKHPVQREIIDAVFLAEGEIGATVSDTPSDVSKLPKGQKAAPVKKRTQTETLRDVTKNAYNNANKKIAEQKQRQHAAIEDKKSDDADLDALLDSMM